jgi:hypothetical protein
MDILNFISWIRGGRQVTTVDPAKTLLPVGLKDPKRDDGYLAGAISVADLAAQIGGGGGAIPVVTVYPTTTSAEAGNQFWYQGNLWHYMTQAEIDSAGWTGLVSVGFPAPVIKTLNLDILSNFTGLKEARVFSFYTQPYYIPQIDSITTIDFLGMGNPVNIKQFNVGINGSYIDKLMNGQLLKSVKNQGTAEAIIIRACQLSATALNDFFTQLPVTTAVATINAQTNPGSATCNPTIATSKGYTVIV